MNLLQPHERPSDTRFGYWFTALFAALTACGLVKHWPGYVDVLWGALAIVVGLTTLFASRYLAPFNAAWFRLGIWMNKVISPLVLGAIFLGLFTPIAVMARLCGRDELRLKQRTQASYWIDRIPPGPAPQSFKNQF